MNIYKRLKPLVLCLILLIALAQAILLPILGSRAYAASITFKWKDAQTLSVSGAATGDLVGATKPGPSSVFAFSGSVKSDKCNTLAVNVDVSENKVTIPQPGGGSIGNPGTKACDTSTLGVSGSQPIQNQRPSGAAAENADQRTFRVILVAVDDGKAPGSVKFTLKNSAGAVISSPDVSKASGEAAYSFTFPGLDEGDYTISFSAIDGQPHTFHKTKYVAGRETYGNDGIGNNITVEVKRTVTAPLGTPVTIPGPAIELRQGETIVQTLQASEYTHTPNQAEKDAAGSATQELIAFQNVTFRDVAPGDYQVCIANTEKCSDVHKSEVESAKVTIDGGVYNPADENSDSPTCQTGGFGLNWILCPIFNLVASFADWLFQNLVQPLLITSPISTDPADPSYKIWSNFRIYGDIFLVIALLVIVFGQSIGGGLVDAYTAKKVLPRLLAAAILINLSIYIVAFAVDITNIVGGGLGNLITGPIKDAGAFKISPSGIQQGVIVGATLGGGIAVAGTGMLAALATTEAASFIMLFVLLPVVLGLLAALLTLVLRQAIILALVIVSPVAFALYCLPNTEKYFKKWWEFLVQTLLVYPIVILIFAVADVMSVTFPLTTDGTKLGVIGPIIAFLLQFLPLLLIPYAFKLAGGAIGRVHDLLGNYNKRGMEAAKGNANDPNSLRNQVRGNMKNALITSRSNKLNALRSTTTGDGPGQKTGFRRKLALGQMRAVNYGYNDLDRLRKDQNETFDKDISGKVAAGADFLERAFFAQQWKGPDRTIDYVDENGNAGKQTLASGRYYSTYRDRNGKYKEHNTADVQKAHRMYDGNESKIQALIKYETGKVANDQDMYGVDAEGNTIYDPSQINSKIDRTKQPMGSFLGTLPTVMRESGLSNSSAIGASTGSFFSTQAQRKELKHTSLQPDWTWKQNKYNFVQDFAENMASYGAATGKTSPIERLATIHAELVETKKVRSLTKSEQDSYEDITKIATGLDTRMAQGGLTTADIKEGSPSLQPGGVGGNTGGAGRVNDAIKRFITQVENDR